MIWHMEVCPPVWTPKQAMQFYFLCRLIEDTNSEEFSVADMTELEDELDAALVQTRSRKVIICCYLFIDFTRPMVMCVRFESSF